MSSSDDRWEPDGEYEDEEDEVELDDERVDLVLDEEEDENSLKFSSVESRYKAAKDVLQEALNIVVAECKPDVRIVDICSKGDSAIMEKVAQCYRTLKSKGIAFPTCLSVNGTVCHFSPLAIDPTVLKANDIVKIDMACHVDGFVAVGATTIVVTDGPVTGRAADILCAADTAANIILNLVKPGIKMNDVTKAIQVVARAFNCNVLEVFRCHQLNRFDCKRPLLSVAYDDEEGHDAEFIAYRAYVINIALTTGQGKADDLDEFDSTIYRSLVGDDYQSQVEELDPVVLEVMQKFPTMPFCARALEQGGVQELEACARNHILQPYPVLRVKSGDLVAHIKFTYLVTPRKLLAIPPPGLSQVLRPMISVENNADIMKLKIIDTQGRKSKDTEQDRRVLRYCGRLAIGQEASGVTPVICDISWNQKPKHWSAEDVLACTGSFGTCIYSRSQAIKARKLTGDIEDGWKKELVWNTPGKFCQWTPDGKLLAVGIVIEPDQTGEVHIVEWDNNFQHHCIYVGKEDHCVGMNSLSWSRDSKHLLVASKQTRHVVVITKQSPKDFVQPVRFVDGTKEKEDLIAAFHPSSDHFVAASSSGHLKVYRLIVTKSRRTTIYEWLSSTLWMARDDNCGINALSFNEEGDQIACARFDLSVKVLQLAGSGFTSITVLYTIAGAGLCDISIKWSRRGSDFLTVGDGMQSISIYRNGHQRLCDNKHSVDINACFSEANRMDWHPKDPCLLASGGREGFILFWSHQVFFQKGFAQKERHIHLENLFYNHRSLPKCGTSKDVLEEYDSKQNMIRAMIQKMVDVTEIKDKQLDRVAALANSGLERMNRGEELSQEEFKEYLQSFLHLSTKEV